MKHCGTNTLETDRLILRRFEITDAKEMYENWASDDNVTKYLMWPTHTSIAISETIINEWVASYVNDNFYQWAILLKEENKLVGSISIVDSDDTTFMLHAGYCIGKKWWHRGITSEALKCVIDYLFNETMVKRIESRHDPRNVHSGEVMKKCGMVYEGTHRSSDWNNQGICDASYYSILREEWECI